MRDNPIQFAVVREDPQIVIDVLRRHRTRHALLVGSGGCTALSVRTHLPDVEVTALDPNPAQLALIERKIAALGLPSDARRLAFNLEVDDPTGLSQCGNFESLFRGLRRFLNEHVANDGEILRWFDRGSSRQHLPAQVFSHPYWPVAFQLFFHDALLETMFGEDATQHATPGSYPSYFQRRFEVGLLRDDAPDNYFLHHVLLGRYLDREPALPPFLQRPTDAPSIAMRQGFLQDCDDIERFDLVDLSNVMDWMGDAAIDALCESMRRLRPGSVVIYRQLNNAADHERRLADFRFDESLGAELLRRDRSLFYESIHVGVRD